MSTQQPISPVSPSSEVVPPVSLTSEENYARGKDFQQLLFSSQLRETSHPQFDGMGYTKYNETNEMADMSFLPPKKNKMDTRMVTGITHEKDSTLLSMLLDFNFEVRVRPYDSNQEELIELGNAISAMLRKSRELEKYEEKRPILYRGLIVQGTAFTRERYIQQYVPKKVIEGDVNFTEMDTVKWTEAGYEKVYDGCVTEYVDGKKVFLQDIRQPDIRKQPRVFTVEYITREYAETLFSHFSRWKNVPKTITPQQYGQMTLGSIYSDWTFSEVDNTKVEIIEVFKAMENTYQLYLNGVPMLRIGFPLTAISASGMCPIAKGDIDHMNLFAYSKSIPAKTKIDQAVLDEVVRLMLIKFKQGAFVPRGNLSNKILSENILIPGRFTPDISPKDIPALIDNPGLTNADFSFYSLIEEQMAEKSVAKSLEGAQPHGDMTASQYLDQQKKAMLKLGSIVDAVINWEKQMAHLRTIDILQNWTNEIEQNVDNVTGEIKSIYQNISVDDTFDDGKKGTRMIKFTTQNSEADRTSESVHLEEMEYNKRTGKTVRYTYIDPVLLKNLKATFYYEIIPTDKNNDKLTQMLFIQNMIQAMNIFGPQSMNMEYLKKRFAYVIGEDFEKYFNQNMPPEGMNPAVAGMGNPQGMMQKQQANGINVPQPNMMSVANK
jgi:hypothetical protein